MDLTNATKNGYRRHNGRDENKRYMYTTTGLDYTGSNDDRWLQNAERRGPTERGVAKSCISTCLRGRESQDEIVHETHILFSLPTLYHENTSI